MQNDTQEVQQSPPEQARVMGLTLDAFAFIVGGIGYAAWTAVQWSHRLVLRDSSQFLGAPVPVICAAFIIALPFTVYVASLALRQQRKWVNFGKKSPQPTILGTALILLAGIVFFVCAAFAAIDIFLDSSPPTVHPNAIVQTSTNSGFSRRRYYVLVRDWQVSQGTLKFRVNTFTYDKYKSGQLTSITSHRGFLGCEWINIGL